MVDPGEPSQSRADLWLPKDGWSPEEIAALGAWTQGALIEGAAIAWLGIDNDPATGMSEGRLGGVATDPDTPGFLVVTSQTCDIGATGPGAKHPFVTASPLLNADDLSQSARADALNWRIRYLAPIPNVPGGGHWLADLRLSTMVSKSLLIAEKPIGGFTDSADAARFADWLAMKVRRPALHGALSEGISDILCDVIKTADKSLDPSWYQHVEQIRLEVAPNRLTPTWVRVRVVCEWPLDAPAQAQWRTANKRIKQLLRSEGIDYGQMVFSELRELSAREYRDSVHLPVNRLGRPTFW